jgi:long-chain acyl-CoA synthetase
LPITWWRRGLKPGTKISTICNNSVEFVKALFGIHRAGLVWVPVNTMLGPADMDYILDHAEVNFALIDDNLHAQADRRAALQKRGIDLIAVDLAGTAAAQGLENFNDLIKGQPEIEPEVEIDDRDLAMIISWRS